MRSPVMICSLALAVMGRTAPCHAAPQTKAYGPMVQEEKQDSGEKTPALTSAEVDWQVIALRQEGVDRCPQVSGWDSDESWLVRALRPPARQRDRGYGDNSLHLEPLSREPRGVNDKPVQEVRRAIAADPLLRGLDRFCAYAKKSVSTADFPDPPPAGLEKAEKGHMALVAAGEPDLGQAGDLALARHFIAQATGMGSNPGGTAGPGRPVRLVFVDTQPDFDGVPREHGLSSMHGYTLVHLADQLLRQFDPGSVELATRLALPHSGFDPHQPPAESLENSQGGNLGLVDELAVVILREVFAWRNSGSKEHLVLNLSVGWDGELLGELDKRRVSQLGLDSQLVYKALQYARRSHALVIAAAGNRRGGGESNWPLLPAAWELHRPSVLPFALGPKPVYAVGGVDWQGLPLANYRFGGLPRRVAFGDHAMAQTVAPDEPTAMYTGSSVSAAVVSAIAAEVWHLLPEASPDEVMRLVTKSGDVLPGRGDYYAWKNLWPLSDMVAAPHMRRVSLCRAVTWACLAGKRQCSIPCQPWDATTRAADLSAFVLSTSLDAAPDLKPAALPADCRSASDPTPRFYAVNDQNAPDPCPLYLLPDMVSQRWVAPQPDDPPCPGCSLIPPHFMSASLAPGSIPVPPEGYVLAIDIDEKWWMPPYSIDSAALDVDRYSGNGKFVERVTYAIPMVDLKNAATGNHRLHLKEVGNGGSLAGCTASLNTKVTVQDPKRGPRTYSVQSPVYVDPKLPR